MSTTNQIRRSYQNDQSACIIACHGIITQKSQRYPLITIDGGHIGRSHSSKECQRKHYTFLQLCIKYFLAA